MNLLGQTVATVLSLRSHELALYVVAATFAYFTLNAIYRVTLHPLAKYPGPLLQKISDWPMVIQCYNGNRHIKLLQDHEKYGSIIRTGPNSLSINTVEAIKAIYSDRNANVKRGEWYKSIDISSGAHSVNGVLEKKEHAFRRSIISQAFSERALRDAEGFILKTVKVFREQLGKGAEKAGEWTPRKNLNNMATYFAFDFISDLAFGNTLEMMVKEEPRYIRNVLMHASQFLNYLGYLPFVALVRPFLGTSVQDYIGGQSAADSLKFTRLANDRMAERIEAGEQAKRSGKEMRKDIFHHLLIARDAETGLGLTIEELQADAFLLIAAGSDTIAMTISACIFYLMRHPSAYANLQAEIRSAFSSPDEIRSPKLHNLPYLMASIQETLRLNPPAPSHFQRLVQPGGLMISNPPIDGSDDVDNKNNGTSTSSTLPETILIPAGTNVGVPPYAIHHNETYYPDSWSFRPERWIVSPETGTSPASLALARRAYCPFSTGSMDCVAKNMAYLTIKLALANMLWAFDIRLAPKVVGEGSADVQFYTGLRDATGAGDPEASDEGRKRIGEYQMVDFAAGYRDGPMIELRERGSSS